MIGQKKILEKINRWQEVPRFIILNGEKGCGKKTLSKYIANTFKMQPILIEYKIDNIREMIQLAKEFDNPILFIIDEGNKMSLGAENTLLKVTEEAPNNAHIVLTVENKNLLLPTILSRGEVFNFIDYNINDFNEYAKLIEKEPIYEEIISAYPNLSYLGNFTPGEATELINFCTKILKRIREANGANAFKILEKLKLKDEQEGYELKQFLYCLKKVCGKLLIEEVKNTKEYQYQADYLKIINEIEKMMSNPLFNRNYIFDKLILDFKGVYY